MCLAIPGKIVSLSGAEMEKYGRVSFGGITKEVSLALVPEAAEGDYVLVHAGYAISVIDEEEAQRTLEYLDEIIE